MKALDLLFVIILVSSANVQASKTVEQTFVLESGAVWTGVLTFEDDYKDLLDAEGWILGGTHDYKEYLNWTWRADRGLQNRYSNQGNPFYSDWLMDGTSNNFSFFLGISWHVIDSANGRVHWLIEFPNAFFNGWYAQNDLIVQATPNAVPLPPTAILWLSASLAWAAMRTSRHLASG